MSPTDHTATLRTDLRAMRDRLGAGDGDFDFAWAVPDVLAVTTRPLRCHPDFPFGPLLPGALPAVEAWVNGIEANGFRTIICFNTAPELEKYYGQVGLHPDGLIGYYESRGLVVCHVPWDDPAHIPGTSADADRVYREVEAMWPSLEQPVLMHCSMACDRSPAVAERLAPNVA